MACGNKKLYNRIMAIVLCLVVLFGVSGCKSANGNGVGEKSWKENDLLNTEVENTDIELDSSLLAGEVADIVERGKLIVGMRKISEFTLFASVWEGQYTGLDAYYAEILAEGLGVELVIDDSYDGYEELISALLNGNIDLIVSGMSITNDRAKYINYSEPYLSGRMALMCDKSVLVESDALENPVSYIQNNDVVIGIHTDAYYGSVIKALFPNAQIVYSDSRDELVRLVSTGQIFAYVENDAMFIYYSAKYPELTLHTQVYVVDEYKDEIGIGVRPEDVNLLNYVNVCITSEKMTNEDIDGLCREAFGFY